MEEGLRMEVETHSHNPYLFQSIFCCVTNYGISLLGSGKTIATIHLFISRMKKFPNALGFSNVTLFDFPKDIQERIMFYSTLLELQDILKTIPQEIRKIVLLDEAQNEFDRRLHSSKVQVYKTIFLNFFRKFNMELYFNVVNENRIEFRLGDMCTHIFIPSFVNKNIVRVEAILLGNTFYLKANYYYNKYKTLEDIRTDYEQKNSYLVDKISKDETFYKLADRKVKKGDIIHYIHEKYMVSKDTASLLYTLVVLKNDKEEIKTKKEG